MDLIDGDPDFEADTSDFELSGDEQGDPAWCEWTSLPSATQRSGSLNAKPVKDQGVMPEDVEDCDPAEDDDEDCCRAGEDDATVFSRGHQIGFSGDRAASDPDCEPSGDELDTGDGEDECLSLNATRWLIPTVGCEIGDPGEYDRGEHRVQCEPLPILELNDN